MTSKREFKPSERCAFQPACYLASDLKCYGYKTDCILYRKTNNEPMDAARFDQAMDELIDKTRAKYLAKSEK